MHSKNLFFLLILFCNCSPNTTKGYLNRTEDIDSVKPMATEYYQNIQSQNYEMAFELFSDSFFITSPKEKMIEYYNMQYTTCGRLISFNFTSGHSFVREGRNPSFGCTLDCLVNYEKCLNQRETLFFKKEKNKLVIRGCGH
jgi:hypothetical protein